MNLKFLSAKISHCAGYFQYRRECFYVLNLVRVNTYSGVKPDSLKSINLSSGEDKEGIFLKPDTNRAKSTIPAPSVVCHIGLCHSAEKSIITLWIKRVCGILIIACGLHYIIM